MSTIQGRRSYWMRVCRSKWYLPAFGVVLGLIMLVVMRIRG